MCWTSVKYTWVHMHWEVLYTFIVLPVIFMSMGWKLKKVLSNQSEAGSLRSFSKHFDCVNVKRSLLQLFNIICLQTLNLIWILYDKQNIQQLTTLWIQTIAQKYKTHIYHLPHQGITLLPKNLHGCFTWLAKHPFTSRYTLNNTINEHNNTINIQIRIVYVFSKM